MQNTSAPLRDSPAAEELSSVSAKSPHELWVSADRSVRPGIHRDSSHDQNIRAQHAFPARILVPTDFSASATKAVEHAVGIARHCNARLTILHVININAPTKSGPADLLMKDLWDEGSARMAQLAWSLRGQIEAKTTLEEGLPWDKIVELSGDFDLLILGQPRCKSRWKFFSQHTAQRVIERAACPVMVVTDPA